MQVKKTIRCKIIGLTNIKKDILNQEYDNLQEFLQLKEVLWWEDNLGKDLQEKDTTIQSKDIMNIQYH